MIICGQILAWSMTHGFLFCGKRAGHNGQCHCSLIAKIIDKERLEFFPE